jgi:hypothetical protein
MIVFPVISNVAAVVEREARLHLHLLETVVMEHRNSPIAVFIGALVQKCVIHLRENLTLDRIIAEEANKVARDKPVRDVEIKALDFLI